MKLKRSKTYKKQMGFLKLNFNFREPYQVLLDEEIILDAVSMKYDLKAGLERTLQGTVKPMVTQCTVEHLYRAKTPEAKDAVKLAKSFERRRCGHVVSEHDETKPAPLSAFECLCEVVGETNKHRYVVATQKPKLRQRFRKIPGLPLIYLSRSVMIMEPMSKATETRRKEIEEAKLLSGLNKVVSEPVESHRPKAKKAKGPNPLSVKKRQRPEDEEGGSRKRRRGKRSHADDLRTEAPQASEVAS